MGVSSYSTQGGTSGEVVAGEEPIPLQVLQRDRQHALRVAFDAVLDGREAPAMAGHDP